MVKNVFFWGCALFFVLYLVWVKQLSSSLGAPQHTYSVFDIIEGAAIAVILSAAVTSVVALLKRLINKPK